MTGSSFALVKRLCAQLSEGLDVGEYKQALQAKLLDRAFTILLDLDQVGVGGGGPLPSCWIRTRCV